GDIQNHITSHSISHQHQIITPEIGKSGTVAPCRQSAIELQPAVITNVSDRATEQTSGLSCKRSDSDVDSEMIESLRDQAIVKFETEWYADAEGFVRKAIQGSKAMHGARFDGRDGVLELLAIA